VHQNYLTEFIGISLIAKIDRFPSLGSKFLWFSEISIVAILNIQMAILLYYNIEYIGGKLLQHTFT
jgi:hypothetical protein